MEGDGGATAVKIEEAGQRQAFFEWDDGQQGVSLEGEGECGVGSSMAVTVSLPEGGIALLIVAVFDAPVPRTAVAAHISVSPAGLRGRSGCGFWRVEDFSFRTIRTERSRPSVR